MRDRFYSGPNLLGLSVGLAASGLIALFVLSELQYDQFHSNKDRIYHVVMGTQDGSGDTAYSLGSFGDVGEWMTNTFPEVEVSVRIFKKRVLIRRGELKHFQQQCLVDSSIFRAFTIPLRKGDSRKALIEPWSMVISESMAKRYFGAEDPIGQELFTDNPFYLGGTYHVTGVFDDFPRESHIQFDCASATPRVDNMVLGSWGPYLNVSHSTITYLLLREGADPGRIESGLKEFAVEYIDAHRASQKSRNAAEFDGTTFQLHSLNDVYLYSGERFGIPGMGSARTVSMFSLIALLIVLLACCNYTNLATARSLKRLREVGLRRVVGARRAQLISQFLGESILMTVIAAIVAVGWIKVFLPFFEVVIGRSIQVGSIVGHPTMLLAIAGLVLGIGVMAGGYPALFVSRFRLSDVFGRANVRSSGTVSLRQLLVVFQFCVSIGLVICTITSFRQMDFIQSKDLGYNRSMLVKMPLISRNRELLSQADEIKQAVTDHPNVMSVTSHHFQIGRNVQKSPVTPEGEPHESWTMIQVATDENFLKTAELDVIAGRSFSRDRPTDETEAFMLNETAVRMLGWDEPLGKTFEWRWRKGRVIGVVQDFHLEPLNMPIGPAYFMMWPEKHLWITARIATRDVGATIAHLATVWKRFLPNFDFEYVFLDDDLASHYLTEQKQARVLGGLSLLAVLIACLGLLGLSAFSVQRRTKEIGIRKALGGSRGGLVVLLSREYVRDVLIAGVIAVPVGLVTANQWLQSFTYRVDVGGGTLAAGFGICLLFALGAVSAQTSRAAGLDPAKSLREEG